MMLTLFATTPGDLITVGAKMDFVEMEKLAEVTIKHLMTALEKLKISMDMSILIYSM